MQQHCSLILSGKDMNGRWQYQWFAALTLVNSMQEGPVLVGTGNLAVATLRGHE